jgi:hypothetical protein
MTSAEVLTGWEPGVHYVKVSEATRGQAKALVADATGEWFLDLRSRKVWLHEREITEADAEYVWLDDWYPGYVAWIGCKPDAPGAEAWWEIRLRREPQYARAANSHPEADD